MKNKASKLVGSLITQEGQLASVVSQKMDKNDADAVLVPSALVVEAKITADVTDEVTKIETTVPNVFDAKQVSATKPDVIPEKFRASVPSETTEYTTEGTSVTMPSLGPNEIAKSEQRVTEHKKRVSVTTRATGDLSGVVLDGQVQGVWGVETVEERLVSSPAIAPEHGVKESQTSPLAVGQYLKVVQEYPDNPATLIEYKTDEETGLVIKMEKSLVNPTSPLPAGIGIEKLLERQALDKWHSIQIVSYRANANQLPDSEVFDTLTNIDMPDFLEELGVFWEPDQDTSADAEGVIGASSYPKDKSWGLGATARASASINGAGWLKIKQGYSGPANATVTRTYHNGPPTGMQQIHLFRPVTGMLIVTSNTRKHHRSEGKGGVGEKAFTRFTGSGGSYGMRRQYLMIPSVEHNNPPVQVGGASTVTASTSASAGSIPGGGTYPAALASATATGSYELKLPASSTPLVSGQTFVRDVDVRKWRFGIWVKEVIVAKVP